MTVKPLCELIEQTEEQMTLAEQQYEFLPSVINAIRLVEAMDNYEEIQEIYNSIMINFDKTPPPVKKKRKKSGNKAERDRHI